MTLSIDAISESHTGGSGSASEASFSWVHAGGTPIGVLVFVLQFGVGDALPSVTYGGVTVPYDGDVVCTDGVDDGRAVLFWLNTGALAGSQTVEVTRPNNTNIYYANCVTLLGLGANLDLTAADNDSTSGILAEHNLDDSFSPPPVPSIRFAAAMAGIGITSLVAGANSTLGPQITLVGVGGLGDDVIMGLAYETVPGNGNRPVGFDSGIQIGTRAGFYVAISDTAGGGGGGGGGGSGVTTNYAVTIDSNLLVWQPSRVIPHPPTGHDVQAVHGDWLGFARSQGWRFELVFGQTLAHDDFAEQLKTIQEANDTGVYVLSFVWFDGEVWEFNVLWDEQVAASFRWGSVLEEFTIELYEAYQ